MRQAPAWLWVLLLLALTGVDGTLLYRALRGRAAVARAMSTIDAVETASEGVGRCDGLSPTGQSIENLCDGGAIVLPVSGDNLERTLELWVKSGTVDLSGGPRLVGVCTDDGCAHSARVTAESRLQVLTAASFSLARALGSGDALIVLSTGVVVHRARMPTSIAEVRALWAQAEERLADGKLSSGP